MAELASSPTVELDVMVTARLRAPHGYAFRPPGGPAARLLGVLRRDGGEPLDMPCLAYAIRHPAAGTILVDTGMHPGAREDLRGDFGTPMGVMFRGIRPAPLAFGEQLRELGIEPATVTRVVMTHLHVDHTSGMRLLPAARFTVSRDEWRAARARLAVRKGYVAHHLPPGERVDLVDFEAHGEPYGAFRSTIDLLGDGAIRLISTPGHTAGHLSVLLRVAGDRDVLVVGDAAYTRRNIDDDVLPLLTEDDQASRASMAQIRGFAAAEPQAILVPTHDPTAWHALGAVTASAQRELAVSG